MAQAHDMSWQTHPFRQQKMRGMLGLICAAAAVVLAQLWARSLALTTLSGLLLLVTLWPFYFPVRYHLGPQGVQIDYGLVRRRWSWDRFRVFVPVSAGALLSPFPEACLLERYRAILLPYPRDRASLLCMLRIYLSCRTEDLAEGGG